MKNEIIVIDEASQVNPATWDRLQAKHEYEFINHGIWEVPPIKRIIPYVIERLCVTSNFRHFFGMDN